MEGILNSENSLQSKSIVTAHQHSLGSDSTGSTLLSQLLQHQETKAQIAKVLKKPSPPPPPPSSPPNNCIETVTHANSPELNDKDIHRDLLMLSSCHGVGLSRPTLALFLCDLTDSVTSVRTCGF